MHSAKTAAARFKELDLHDDTLVEVHITPSRNRQITTRVELVLYRYWEKKTRLLIFQGCANISFQTDFDVLKANHPNNTFRANAWADAARTTKLVMSQRRLWNVTYEPESSSLLRKKLPTLNKYALFRVQFCGGVMDVVAKRYRVQTSNHRWQRTA